MYKSNLIWVKKEHIRDIDNLKRRLTVRSKYDGVAPIATYEENGEWFGIPRNISVNFDYEDKTIFPSLPHPIKFKGTLRHHQELAFQDWLEYRDSGITDTIFNMEVRSGKTVISLRVAVELQTPFLVIVPRVNLISQWKDEILKFTSIPNGKIGEVRQGACQWKDKLCVVGTVHSIYKDKYGEEFKDKWGLVIFDEVHRMGSKGFGKAVKMFPARYRIGLTGTLRRSDGMVDVFLNHLGKNIISVTSEKYLPKVKVIEAIYSKSSGNLPYWAKTKMQQRACLLSLLADNDDRNQKIVSLVKVLVNSGRRVLVASERIKQLYKLENMLKTDKEVRFCVNVVIERTSKEEREDAFKNSDVILGSTDIFKEGVTIRDLRSLIMATPLGDVEQLVGRIRNPDLSLPDPIVIDIIDTYYLQTRGWLYKRRKIYSRISFETVSINL